MQDSKSARFMVTPSTPVDEASVPLLIPLPTELPPPPDLSRLPSHIVHSGTVETLIGQNDDLMARLKVNLRRNAVLEQQIMEQEKVNGELLRANNSIMSQMQLLQEKDAIWKEKTDRNELHGKSQRHDIDILKAKLRTQENFVKSARRAEGYVRRIRRWVIPFIDQLKLQVQAERKTVFAKEAVISDLRSRLSATIEHAQTIESRTARDQSRLVSQYEEKYKSVAGDLEKLQSESKLWREKASRMESAVATSASAENRIILLERQAQEAKSQAETARGEARALAGEVRSLMLEIDRLRTDLKASEAKSAESKADAHAKIETYTPVDFPAEPTIEGNC